MFNATLGFTYDRLITWILKTADNKFDLDDEMVEKRLHDLGEAGGATEGAVASSEVFLAEISLRSPRKLFIFTI